MFFLFRVSSGFANPVCPTLDDLEKNKTWLEADGADSIAPAILEGHFKRPLERAALIYLEVPTERGTREDFWIGIAARRDMTEEELVGHPECRVLGSVAFYADYWLPDLDFFTLIREGHERDLVGSGQLKLIELRWFDPNLQRRVRWFDTALARNFEWLEGSRPIDLPRPINSLY